MAILHSKFVRGAIRIPSSDEGGEMCGTRFYYDLLAASFPALNDIIEIAVLPAQHTVLDMILDSDALAASGLTLDVGLMSGNVNDDGVRTIGAEFFAAATIGVAGGVVRPTLKTAFRVAKVAYDRSIGIKIAAAAVTPASGQIGLIIETAP